ncbi:MAG: putative rane protein [Clostridia bacterium]|jgi:energy-coupling factor transport system substrate-specific component|nr:putative rane protein [Clostridia bacterium]
MKKITPIQITFLAFCIVLNIAGAAIALNLRLPIYLDSVGTLLAAAVLGPVYGVVTGVTGSIVSGITFDIYSLYFMPVQIIVGFLGGLMFRRGLMKGFKMPIGVLIVTLFASLLGAVIAAFVFGGVTSSGSSYIVVFLSQLGVNKVVSVFIVQFFTDYADKFVAVLLVRTMTTVMPQTIKLKLVRS